MTSALVIAVFATNSCAWTIVSTSTTLGMIIRGDPDFKHRSMCIRTWCSVAMRTRDSQYRVCPIPRTASGIRLWLGSPTSVASGQWPSSTQCALATASLLMSIKSWEASWVNLWKIIKMQQCNNQSLWRHEMQSFQQFWRNSDDMVSTKTTICAHLLSAWSRNSLRINESH